jgi:carbonic anhydrase
MNRRRFLSVGLALPVFAGTSKPQQGRPSSADVLRDLIAGNVRFATGHAKHPHMNLRRLHELAAEQHPRAVVLTCSDSRVPPELVFDQGLGDLFVVRVAGNVANNDEIASCEYAIEHFDTNLLVVLGHSQCGAVSAVVKGEHVPEDVHRLVIHLTEAVDRVRKAQPQLQGPDLVAASVKANVFETIDDLKRGCHEIADRVRDGRLKIVGGVYNLADGRVTWI